MLRPACHRCTARYGITEPVACHLPPHQTVCRRHRLWAGPAARSHGHQFDISPFPEIGRAHRRHLALAHQHGWWHVDFAVSDATRAIYQALRAGTWIPGQQRGCAGSPPAPGNRPWPVCSVSAPASQTTARPVRRRDRDLPGRRLARRLDCAGQSG